MKVDDTWKGKVDFALLIVVSMLDRRKNLKLESLLTPIDILRKIYSFHAERKTTPLLINTLAHFLESELMNIGFKIRVPDSKEVVGAATLSWLTREAAVSNEDFKIAFVQRCHRPLDARINHLRINLTSRSSVHTQFQIIGRPAVSFDDMRGMTIHLVNRIGLDICKLEFKQDNWSNSIISAYGKGFEVWYDKIEIAQCTVFESYLGRKIAPMYEIVFGLERLLFVGLYTKFSNLKRVVGYRSNDKFYGRIKAKQSVSFFKILDLRFNIITESIREEKDSRKRWNLLLSGIHIFNMLDLNLACNPFRRLNYMKSLRKLSSL